MESLTTIRNRYASEVANNLQKTAIKKGWDLSGTRVYARGSEIRVDFGEKKYLSYVNEGTHPFLMHSLEGKVIPMAGGFRTVKGVGLPGIVSFERNGVRVNKMRWQKWRHPGIKGQHFVEAAIEEANETMGPSLLALQTATKAKFTLESFRDAIRERVNK